MLRALVDEAIAILLPDVCAGCGARGVVVCALCAATLRPAPSRPPPAGVDWWVSRFSYEGVAREIVARAKYRDNRRGLSWLAAEMQVGLTPLVNAIDVVTWAPASRVRRFDRGIDHGQVLASAIGVGLHLPVACLLARRGDVPQTGAPRVARAQGPALRATRPLGGVSVLVIDDVATTGSTMRAAATALRVAGAHAIAAATATRTPHRVRG